jgi:hypothetical protein
MEKLPTFSELLGIDKFNLTESQRNDCISLANQWGIEAATKQAEIFSVQNNLTPSQGKE